MFFPKPLPLRLPATAHRAIHNQIATLENLYWIASNSAQWGRYYIQTADIDASSTLTWFSGAGWIPIGNGAARFTGQYDGQNYSISKLWIHRPTEYYVGCFGYTNNSTISNLKIENFNFRSGYYVGGLVGYMIGDTISNCTSSGSAFCFFFC